MNAKRGFLLGKFMPPHRGHLFLCKSALEMVDELTVLVCSTNTDDMPGDLRHEWMDVALPRAAVLHLHRDLPQAPEDDPDFWEIWREVINEIHPQAIDCVFGSEPYVFRLAEELGAKPVLVDPERDMFPVSGSAIRKTRPLIGSTSHRRRGLIFKAPLPAGPGEHRKVAPCAHSRAAFQNLVHAGIWPHI